MGQPYRKEIVDSGRSARAFFKRAVRRQDRRQSKASLLDEIRVEGTAIFQMAPPLISRYAGVTLTADGDLVFDFDYGHEHEY